MPSPAGSGGDGGPAARRLVMFPDYGSRTPLWTDDSPRRGVPLDTLPLSQALRNRLRAWCVEFDANYTWDAGWSSAEAERTFVERGEALLAELRDASGGRVIVIPRFGSAEEAMT